MGSPSAVGRGNSKKGSKTLASQAGEKLEKGGSLQTTVWRTFKDLLLLAKRNRIGKVELN